MKLKNGKRIIYGLIAAIGVALVACMFLPERWVGWGYFSVLALLGVFAIACVLLLRCPYCYGQVHLWGQKYCPTCGRQIDEESGLTEPQRRENKG